MGETEAKCLLTAALSSNKTQARPVGAVKGVSGGSSKDVGERKRHEERSTKVGREASRHEGRSTWLLDGRTKLVGDPS